jgi:drug/metabolite transporter (DMT)-like permease
MRLKRLYILPRSFEPSGLSFLAKHRFWQAVFWISLSHFFLTGLSSLVRYESAAQHPFQIAFLRSVGALLLMCPHIIYSRFQGLSQGRWRAYLLRSSIGTFSMLLGFYALSLMPLAEVTAIGFTLPLFATIGAALFLGETVYKSRWWAIFLGFIGVIIMLWPHFTQSAHAHLPALLALGATFASAIVTLIVKHLARTESILDMAAYMALFFTVFSLPFALYVWQPLNISDYVTAIFMGLLANLGHLCWYKAYKLADASALLPYDYAKLLVASLYGWWFFNEISSFYTWAGASILICTGVYMARQEAKRHIGQALA